MRYSVRNLITLGFVNKSCKHLLLLLLACVPICSKDRSYEFRIKIKIY